MEEKKYIKLVRAMTVITPTFLMSYGVAQLVFCSYFMDAAVFGLLPPMMREEVLKGVHIGVLSILISILFYYLREKIREYL